MNDDAADVIEAQAAEIERLREMVGIFPVADHGELDDGFGNVWPLCKPDCQLEIVRPGKVQCGECDALLGPALADAADRADATYDREGQA